MQIFYARKGFLPPPAAQKTAAILIKAKKYAFSVPLVFLTARGAPLRLSPKIFSLFTCPRGKTTCGTRAKQPPARNGQPKFTSAAREREDRIKTYPRRSPKNRAERANFRRGIRTKQRKRLWRGAAKGFAAPRHYLIFILSSLFLPIFPNIKPFYR